MSGPGSTAAYLHLGVAFDLVASAPQGHAQGTFTRLVLAPGLLYYFPTGNIRPYVGCGVDLGVTVQTSGDDFAAISPWPTPALRVGVSWFHTDRVSAETELSPLLVLRSVPTANDLAALSLACA